MRLRGLVFIVIHRHTTDSYALPDALDCDIIDLDDFIKASSKAMEA
jgi:hypothetical protein